MKELTRANTALHDRTKDFERQLAKKDEDIAEKDESLKQAVSRVVDLQNELQRFVDKHGSQVL